MDFIKEFEEVYLPIWSEEKHKPIPTRKHMDKWNEAWQDFLSEYLTTKYSEIAADYNNMQFKTNADLIKEKTVVFEEIQELPEPEPEVKKSTWELVQEKRKKKL